MKDQLSALMDGELDVSSSDHLFTALKSDRALKAEWDLYHAIGDCMRGDYPLGQDFEQRLLQRLEAEPTLLAPRRRLAAKPAHALSVAASVAAVMFVGWVVVQQQKLSTPEQIAGPSIAQNNVSPESVNSYLLAHHELSPESGMPSAYYVRPVAYAASGK